VKQTDTHRTQGQKNSRQTQYCRLYRGQ